MESSPGIARASVSLLLRPAPDDLEILLIERPRSATDPWSGHMALPGGRWEHNELALDAAVRETMEEVGIDLLREGMQIGRLDDVKPDRGGPQIAVSPFVFVVSERAEPMPNEREVASTVWIPLDHLASPGSAAEHLHVLPGGTRLRFPAIAYHRHVIWGLTYRMLIQFLGVARSIKQGERS
jgi:8-oxo-dGTP pyrophosphatase MutT (NUDIX family)